MNENMRRRNSSLNPAFDNRGFSKKGRKYRLPRHFLSICLALALIWIIGFSSLVLFENSPGPDYFEQYSQKLSITSMAEVHVQEQIKFRIESAETFRGVARYLPEDYQLYQALYRKADEGSLSNYRSMATQSAGVGVLNVGDLNSFLEPGLHEFLVSYKTSNAVHRSEEKFSLAWMVTGRVRSLPLQQVNFTVQFPEIVDLSGLEAQFLIVDMGLNRRHQLRSSQYDYRLEGGEMHFKTRRALKARETLVAYLSWPLTGTD